ncbi:transposase [Desulforamulus aquiferis]|uniref:Transposase n=1 Tax=Desulforamulus aquiferis TaxID=1397668 RepID=A0AAW7Z9W3_9FIRM|nr:transposase [Desulforamulus aquiferis]MDO7786205.1 transposase [Desulforamulus aquiferis]RYD04620.1 hypothetical protein N752_14700 [Desulforamulus aquiferis]
MARKAREKSTTGIYHIMLRGIDKRDIFLDDEDREKFLDYLAKAKEKATCLIYGYCLMDNHVHLLIEEGHEHIGESIKRVAVGYVYWHNEKYSRTGHLFQNRYKSEVVEDDTYFITVLRYIHQNPIKAGLVQDISHYKWSSYIHYIEGSEDLINLDIAMNFFISQDKFIEFMRTPSSEQCLEENIKVRYSDKQLKEIILKLYPKQDLISNLTKEKRDEFIRRIKQYTNASNRQISRVLGIGRGIVERVDK